MKAPSFWQRLIFIRLQYLLPQHFLSRLMLKLTRLECNHLLRIALPFFIKRFRVNMDEAEQGDWRSYPSFNAFFTRALKTDARPIVEGSNNIACPVDGATSQLGKIQHDRIFQAKGHDYSLQQLIGGDEKLAKEFHNGEFATIYLSPRDYHRIHMPVDGKLREVVHVPGKLFSVNPVTTAGVPGLFARNERVVCIFDTSAGPMAMILVGAIFVASIETVWQGEITPPTRRDIQHWDFSDKSIELKKGGEMGRFNMGSTVILLFGKDRMQWENSLGADQAVKLGELLGTTL